MTVTNELGLGSVKESVQPEWAWADMGLLFVLFHGPSENYQVCAIGIWLEKVHFTSLRARWSYVMFLSKKWSHVMFLKNGRM
jgi:hypothetical protein